MGKDSIYAKYSYSYLHICVVKYERCYIIEKASQAATLGVVRDL